jgi:hypothetical protein
VLGDQAPQVGLPSESLWEVACRAGTDTAFHFGDTIDATWANFRGTIPYTDGRSGLFVNHPLPVGSYGLVNPWGLADLHGTLWEWCADVWHPDPLSAPQDGSPRMDPAEGLTDERLLRGGSWFNVPLLCRSAYRDGKHPGQPPRLRWVPRLLPPPRIAFLVLQPLSPWLFPGFALFPQGGGRASRILGWRLLPSVSCAAGAKKNFLS